MWLANVTTARTFWLHAREQFAPAKEIWGSSRDAWELVPISSAGEHLTDQLLLPFALSGGGVFTAEKLNLHARTNMEIIRSFLPVNFVTEQEGPLVRVQIESQA